DKTEWHQVVIFNDNLAKTAEQYLRKGMKVYVEGSLQTRKWADHSGQERYTTEVVLQKFRGELQMLDGKSEGQTRQEQGMYGDTPASGRGSYDDDPDSVPV